MGQLTCTDILLAYCVPNTKPTKEIFTMSDLMTVSEFAQALRLDDTTVRRYIKNGVLDAIALPHRGLRRAYRIRRAELDKILSGAAA
jgi:excisionase family DNA binding protein